MSKYLTIIKSDLQNTRRDPTLLLMLTVPLIMLAFLQFGIPVLTKFVPLIHNYYTVIVVFFVVMNSLFPSFIIAFILLDEKDLQLFPVIKITPLSLSGLLLARIVFIVILGFISSLFIVCFNGLIIFPTLKGIQLAWLSALQAPIITLLIATLAKNKVEGLTYLKAANITLFIPMLILFIETKWENLLAIFPAFWAYKVIDVPENSAYIFVLGNIVLLVYNIVSFKFAIKPK